MEDIIRNKGIFMGNRDLFSQRSGNDHTYAGEGGIHKADLLGWSSSAKSCPSLPEAGGCALMIVSETQVWW